MATSALGFSKSRFDPPLEHVLFEHVLPLKIRICFAATTRRKRWRSTISSLEITVRAP
jgi:hypothetical protein